MCGTSGKDTHTQCIYGWVLSYLWRQIGKWGAAAHETTLIATHPVLIAPLVTHTRICIDTSTCSMLPVKLHTNANHADLCGHPTHSITVLSLSAVAAQAPGSSPCRWKVSEETKITGMKTALSFWENIHTLQGAAAASPWQRWREHEVLESETQGYSIYSCFNNTTPLWKEYYIPCKYDENAYQIFPASVLVQWT